MVFADRVAAGRMLAARLEKFRGADVLVLGIPRGGVVVAAEVARELQAPLDVVVPRKIGAPFDKELAVGAVGPDGTVLFDEFILKCLGLEKAALAEEVEAEIAEMKRRLALYRGGRPPFSCKGRTVIVVDDGIATGLTVRATLRALRKQDPAQLVLAVPVAPRESLEKLAPEADEIVVVHVPPYFYAVGQFYEDFRQTTDSEVISLLAHNWAKHRAD